jgi:hypothetical protein
MIDKVFLKIAGESMGTEPLTIEGPAEEGEDEGEQLF